MKHENFEIEKEKLTKVEGNETTEQPVRKEELLDQLSKSEDIFGREGLEQGFDTLVKRIDVLSRRDELTPEEAQMLYDKGVEIAHKLVQEGSRELPERIEKRGTFQVLQGALAGLEKILRQKEEKEKSIEIAEANIEQMYAKAPEAPGTPPTPIPETTPKKLDSIYRPRPKSFVDRIKSWFGR